MTDEADAQKGKKLRKPKHGVLVKAMDIGTSSDMVARLFLQILQIRDHVVSQDQRDEFDKWYTPIQQNAFEAKTATDRCIALVKSHREKIAAKSICRYEKDVIYVDECIDDDLNLHFKDVFIRFWMAFDGIKAFLHYLGFDTNFIFVDTEKDFDKGKEKFLQKHNTERFKNFVTMIEADRKNWLNGQKKFRNQIEHRGFHFPKVQYFLDETDEIISVVSPVDGVELTRYLELIWENFFVFCEEIVVFFLAEKLPDHLAMYRIPETQRPPENPIKYQVGLCESLQKDLVNLSNATQNPSQSS